jgi:hypothetical protein
MKGSKFKKRAIEKKGKKREKRQDGRKDEWEGMKGIMKERKRKEKEEEAENNNKISVLRCFAFNQFLTIQFPG